MFELTLSSNLGTARSNRACGASTPPGMSSSDAPTAHRVVRSEGVPIGVLRSPSFGAPPSESFARKDLGSPGGPLWSPDCDGGKTVDLSANSFELRSYRLGPSPSVSPVPVGSSTTSRYCKGRPRWPRTTAAGSPQSFGMKHAAPPADPRTLMPPPPAATGWGLRTPPAAKGWEVRKPPAPAPQSTYASPPLLFSQPRPCKERTEAAGSHVTWAIAQPPS